MKKQKRILLFELNEYNKDLLTEASKALSLKNIQKVLTYPQSTTRTSDTYDSNFLEPWVQWVSVHTGTPSSEHQIKHLGDVPHLGAPQIWEVLSQKGVTSGVWGAMNASRNNAAHCQFFLPDPWTFSEPGYPSELNKLLDFPRYLAKNYLDISKTKSTSKLFKFLSVFFSSKVTLAFLTELPKAIKNLIKYKGEHFVAISFTDYILTLVFLEYRRRYNPQFTILFLNSIAHVQHHHWHGEDYKNNERLVFCLEYIDRILGHVLKELDEDDVFIMLNGLSQMNTNKEKPWILYRQFDQGRFLETAGVEVLRVEPHMTYDAHVFFQAKEHCLKAQEILKNAKINGQALFLVESYDADPLKLFYRINFFDKVAGDAVLEINGQKFKFFELFQSIVTRTGKHIPVGTIYSNAPDLPKNMYNHELYKYIVDFYDQQQRSQPAKNNAINRHANP
ncbi:MAG: alkaline phosphatase family protein [Oligoflexia bacterium]|nr:alkaline phosphatase family protein [Oligoflexia bacterium]